MNTNSITNVLNPTNNQDVATKSYVDTLRNDVITEDALKVNKAGDTMTGDLIISKSGTTPDANQTFKIEKKNNRIFINSYITAGYNPLVQSGDKAIIFSDTTGYNFTSGLVIAPHSATSGGIRVLGNGDLDIPGIIYRSNWNTGDLIQTINITQAMSPSYINQGSFGDVTFTIFPKSSYSTFVVFADIAFTMLGSGREQIQAQIFLDGVIKYTRIGYVDGRSNLAFPLIAIQVANTSITSKVMTIRFVNYSSSDDIQTNGSMTASIQEIRA